MADGTPIDSGTIYRVVTTESLRRGLDNYEAFANGTVNAYSDQSLRTHIFQYMDKMTKEGKTIDRDVEGRIELVYTG